MTYDTYSGAEKEKRMRELGIFTSPEESSFKSDKTIKREKALSGELPEFVTPLPIVKDFDYWSQRFRARQEQFKETDIKQEHVVINFPNDTIINFIGDTHVGAIETRYDRLEQEVTSIVNNNDSYVVLAGDLVDGFFFNPAQMDQIEQAPEQFAYIDSMMRYLAGERRLLVGFGGDHDGWVKKMGHDPYYKFSTELRAYYMHGVGYITANVGEQDYKIVGAHQLPGFSIRDNTWASKRASSEVQGADIYFNAHNHQKGYSMQTIKEFGGEARQSHFLALGTYKSTDEYSRKKGWSQQAPEEMFGCAIKLSKDRKAVTYFHSILEANK